MRSVNFRFLFFCVVTLQVFSVYGQFSNRIHEQLRFKKIIIEDGLANNRVESITQDNYGFIWIGTARGISRYDGYEFKNYLRYYINENDSIGSLLSNIYQAKFDSNGTLWIVNRSGICYFNYLVDKFIRFTPSNLDVEISLCKDITEDHLGNIYFATNVGIIKHNINTKENVFYIHDNNNPNSIPAGFVYNVLYDSRDLLWFTINKVGVGYLDQKTGNIKLYSADGTPGSLAQNLTECLYEDSKNNIWIGHNTGGVSKFDFETESFKVYIPDYTHINSGTVRDLLEDSQGTFWFGTMEGLYSFNPENETFFRYAHTTHPISQLSHNSIRSLFIDNHDGLWLGTHAGGVNYTNLHTSGFVKYEFSIFKNEYYLNNNNVYGLTFDKKDNIWVATENGGLNFLDRETGKFTYYMYDPKNINSPRSNNIKTIYIDNDDKIYFSTYRGGISILDKKTGKYKHLQKSEQYPQGIADPIVYDIYPDVADQNILWIDALYNTYLFKKKEVEFIKITESMPGFVNPRTLNRLYSICHTDDNKMIFGSNTLAILNRDNNAFTYIDTIGNGEIKSINFLLIDRNGFLWASINLDFIIKYDFSKKEFEIFNEEDGLPDYEYIEAQEDEMGNLWLSTNRGIVKLENIINSSDDFKISVYDNSDNLQGMEFLYNSTDKSKSGEILFGGTNGFNSFRPENIKPNPYIPNVIITKFSVLGKEVKVGEKVYGHILLTKPIMETKKIRIHHKIKMFTFEFTGFHFVSPENNQFKYILEGYDETWQNTDANIRKATYSNLPRGNYIFKVLGSNNNGKWNPLPASINIIILPPWWETWFFRIALSLFVIVLALSFYFIRVSSLKRQKLVLEEKVDQRTKELKKVNAHLKTSKNEIAKQKNEIERSYNNIKVIGEFGQKLTSTLNLESINSMIFDYVKSLMLVTNFGIGIYNPKKSSIDFPALLENGTPVDDFSSPLSDTTSCAVWSFTNKQVILCGNFSKEYSKYISKINIRTSKIPESIIYVPLLIEEKSIGILTVQSVERNAYSEQDLTMLQMLASYIAIALDNANVYKMLEIRNLEIKNHTEIVKETNALLIERQKKIEEQSEELSETNQSLKILNATKDKFFSIIAHDLKSPFTTILGITEMLITKFDSYDSDKKKQFIKLIYNSAQNIFNLLHNLLQWANTQTGKIQFNPEEFCLKEIVEENVNVMKHMIKEKNLLIDINISDESTVYADKNMISTVIRNLLTNAIKFTDKGKINIKTVEKNGFIAVSIKDTGIGIQKNRIGELFDVGNKASIKGTRGESGTGLGLIICKEFIERNGGNINVQSEIGKGSTFSFSIPHSRYSIPGMNE